MPERQTSPHAPVTARAATGLAGALLVATLSVGASAADFDLSVDGDLITITSDGAEMGEILQSLAEEAGFRLLMPAQMSGRPLRLQMQDVPLKRVLKRLLRDDSFVIITGDNERVVAIHVLPKGNEQTVFVEVADESPAATDSQDLPPETPLADEGKQASQP